MGIRIEWIDPNGENADVKVYRSLTPMTEDNLPEPLTTVVGGVGFYVDNAVARNQLYYYRLSSLGKAGSNETIITPNKGMAYMPYTGPGPQVLKRGDWECGYFGRLPMGDLIAQNELITFAGITAAEYAVTDNEWLKFVYKGKIFFIPKYPVCGTVSWETMYRAGCVYGDIPEAEWAPYAKTTYGVIPQKKQLTVGNHLFTVRHPTSRANPLNTGSANADLIGGEIDQFIALAYRNRLYPDTAGRGQLDDADYPNFVSFTTDLLTTGYCVNRGYSGQGGVDVINVGLTNAGTNPVHGWRPLLVLTL